MREKLSNGEMAVRGDQWPLLLFANQEYDPDDPWEGLFRNQLLVWVSIPSHRLPPELILLYADF